MPGSRDIDFLIQHGIINPYNLKKKKLKKINVFFFFLEHLQVIKLMKLKKNINKKVMFSKFH